MDVKVHDKVIVVTLSRRNLEHLQTCLDSSYGGGLVRTTESGFRLHVVPEENTDHYKDRKPGPGVE